MVHITQEEYDAILKARTGKPAHKPVVRAAKPPRTSRPETKAKRKKPKGPKLNRCRYCNRRADSVETRSVLTDSAGVKWFKCCCSPLKVQRYYESA